jgi:hypothetical protein
VRAIHDGSPAVLRVKTGLRHPGEAYSAVGQAREAMVRRGGGGGGSALTLRWGKVAKGVLFGSFYRGESPGMRGATTRC